MRSWWCCSGRSAEPMKCLLVLPFKKFVALTTLAENALIMSLPGLMDEQQAEAVEANQHGAALMADHA